MAQNDKDQAQRDWPDGVRPMSWDNMAHLGVDQKGVLYWQGKPVMVRRQFELRRYELALATMAALATVVQAIAALVPFFR